MTTERYKFVDTSYPYFITESILEWYPLFAKPEVVEIVLNSLRYMQKEGMNLYAYVIMENHMHLVAQSPNLDDQVQRFKSFTARTILDYLETVNYGQLRQFRFLKNTSGSTHKIWNAGSHPVMIQNEDIMAQKVEYIHANPVRRGYVDKATDWRYSSARNYAGMAGLLEVQTDWNSILVEQAKAV
jgi:REP element-mobilizing transposase RayT